MKKIKLIFLILFVFNLSAKEKSKIKIDTLYFNSNLPDVNSSKVKKILEGVENICPNVESFFSDKIEDNLEYKTISLLNLLNKQVKTTIFTNADALVVAYFCQHGEDFYDQIVLYEFIFRNEQLAKTLIKKISFLYNKKDFISPIYYKTWYYKRIKNKVYFIDYKGPDINSIIYNKLKSNVDLLTN
jgi:hypothetical protein